MIKMYLLFMILTMPNGTVHKATSAPMVFSLDNCNTAAKHVREGIAAKYPKAKFEYRCKGKMVNKSDLKRAK